MQLFAEQYPLIACIGGMYSAVYTSALSLHALLFPVWVFPSFLPQFKHNVGTRSTLPSGALE